MNELVDAVSRITPSKVGGRCTKSLTHATIRRSSSVPAGDVRHSMAFWLSSAARNSARTPASVVELQK